MKIIDWYILKKFLSTFFFVVLILVAIIVVIDFTEKNDDFIKRKAPTKEIIVDYYLNFVPYIANLLSPITVFIATVFVTARLASHTEVIAILSSGISFIRLMKPYLVGAIIIGTGIFFLSGWIIPNANKVRVDFERKYLKDPYYNDSRNIHMKVAPETYVYVESYDVTRNVGYRFTLEHINDTQLKTKLVSQRIEWQPEKEKWKIYDYKIRSINGMSETLESGLEMDTTINLAPEAFDNNYLLYETFTLPELESFIGELQERGADNVAVYQIEKYLRFTSPFAIIILTMIGLIVSARKSRGGVGFQIAFGFVLAFIYILFFIMSRAIAQAGDISPMLAVWLPNMIFAGVGVLMYHTIPR
jgi:lipopolysaccharide export system permease protein